MPLRDHFQPPLARHRAWESFHTWWATSIADQLNARLPSRFFVEVHVHLGNRIEADVAEFEGIGAGEDEDKDEDEHEGANGAPGASHGPSRGVALAAWAPPAPAFTLPAVFPDDIEVQVHDDRADARVVAVVELVSPSNKDRPVSRLAFAAKCAAYLQHGVGLIVADIVTTRHFNLHKELIQLMGLSGQFAMEQETSIYTVAYRPARRAESNLIDVWQAPLSLGAALPVLPLYLRRFGAVPLDLEAAYEDACRRGRL